MHKQQTAHSKDLEKLQYQHYLGVIGIIVKIISNIILLQIPGVGVNGAAIGSDLNNIVIFLISYKALRRVIRLDLKPMKFIVKPLIATGIMSITSYTLYILLGGIIPAKIATIIALLFAVAIYCVSVIALKIFSKEEMTMIPYGTKICKMLERLGIYGRNS